MLLKAENGFCLFWRNALPYISFCIITNAWNPLNTGSPWQWVCTCALAAELGRASGRKEKHYSSHSTQRLFLCVGGVFLPKPTSAGCYIEVLDICRLNLEWMLKVGGKGFGREKEIQTHRALHYHVLPTSPTQMLSVCKGARDAHKQKPTPGAEHYTKSTLKQITTIPSRLHT